MANWKMMEGTIKSNTGVFMRVHVENRIYRSRFADSGKGTLAGLFQPEKPVSTGGKDFFLEAESSSYADASARTELMRQVRNTRLTKDNAAASLLVDKFFSKSKSVKEDLASKFTVLSQAEAIAAQNEINTCQCTVTCIIISLVRRDKDDFPGSKTSVADPTPHREVKVMKLFCAPGTEVNAEYILSLLNENVTSTTPTPEYRVAIHRKNGDKVTEIVRESNEDLRASQAAAIAQSNLGDLSKIMTNSNEDALSKLLSASRAASGDSPI